MVCVNVDKPTKTYTIHGSTSYYPVQRIIRGYDAQYKGLNEMKRDGGWLAFDSLANARVRQQLEYVDYTLTEHCQRSQGDVCRFMSPSYTG